MDYVTRKWGAMAGVVGTWLTGGRYPFIEALGVRITAGQVDARELNFALADLGHVPLAIAGHCIDAAAAESLIRSFAENPATLRAEMNKFLHSLIPRIRQLDEPERSAFERWMNANRCTAPVIFGVPEAEQDGFYMSDLSAFRAGLPAPD